MYTKMLVQYSILPQTRTAAESSDLERAGNTETDEINAVSPPAACAHAINSVPFTELYLHCIVPVSYPISSGPLRQLLAKKRASSLARTHTAKLAASILARDLRDLCGYSHIYRRVVVLDADLPFIPPREVVDLFPLGLWIQLSLDSFSSLVLL